MIRDFFYNILGIHLAAEGPNVFELENNSDECNIENSERNKFYLKQLSPVNYSFRPQTLNEYIGQELAKEKTRVTLEKIMRYKMSHILLSGIKGGGKTTLANIISKNLGYKIHYVVGNSFTMDALKDFLKLNEETEETMCLFLDEVHSINKEIAEFLYPILEDFILPIGEDIHLKPFLFIGATTEKNILDKKYSPLVDRCASQIVLEQYKAEDIEQILKQYNNQVYKENIEDDIFKILSINSRYTPRISIALFDDYIVTKDINKTLRINRIIKNSLTDIDIKILEYLKTVSCAGEDALSIISQQSKQDYKQLYEKFLFSEGYILRGRGGRSISEKGKQFLKEV